MDSVLPNIEEWSHPLFNQGVVVNDKCYLARSDKSGIFSWDMKSNNLKMIHLDEDKVNSSYLYGIAVYYKDSIYFVPCIADSLLVYDLKKDIFRRYAINSDLCKIDSAASFYGGYIRDGKLWMVPKGCHYVARFDMESKAFQYYDSFYTEIAPFYNESWPHIVKTEAFARESIWMLLWESNVVVQFDLEDASTKVFTIGEDGEVLRNIEYDGEQFWLSNQYGEIFSWLPDESSKREKIHIWNDREIRFKLVGDNIWIFPECEDEYAVVNPAISKVDVKKIDARLTSLAQIEYYSGRGIYLMPDKTIRRLRFIEKNNYSIVEATLEVSHEDLQVYQDSFLASLPKIIREIEFSLQILIRWIQTDIFPKKSEQSSSIGKVLYERCYERTNQ